jgi:ferrous iron transport protein A
MLQLTFAPKNKKLKVVKISGGHEVKKRLSEIGIIPGAAIKLSNHGCAGPLIIQMNNSSFALGFGTAMKIIVSEDSE